MITKHRYTIYESSHLSDLFYIIYKAQSNTELKKENVKMGLKKSFH